MEPIILDILPPPASWSDDKVDRWCSEVSEVIQREQIFHITIPEVVQETRNSDRNVPYVPKFDNMHFSSLLKRYLKNLVIIPNKIVVRLSKIQFEEWVRHVYSIGVRHLVLVGGEHSIVSYPGYTVLEAVKYIKSTYSDMKVGGIVIFTRKGEAKRLLEKTKAGMDFFISQIIFEVANMKQVMVSFSKLCQNENIPLPKVYLSLALASKNRDIEFLEWLGVVFPRAVLAYITEEEEAGVEDRCIQAMDMLLDEIFNFMKKDKIDFGFNIEHVMYSNLYLTEKLVRNIKLRRLEL